MSNLTVVFADNHKSVTIIGRNGNRVFRSAVTTMNVCFRKDGGVTVWGDGEPKNKTVRVDSLGRIVNKVK